MFTFIGFGSIEAYGSKGRFRSADGEMRKTVGEFKGLLKQGTALYPTTIKN
jgi:hypothetical protein